MQDQNSHLSRRLLAFLYLFCLLLPLLEQLHFFFFFLVLPMLFTKSKVTLRSCPRGGKGLPIATLTLGILFNGII